MDLNDMKDRNRNLLNHRDSLQNEPVQPTLKPSAVQNANTNPQQQSMKVFRLSKVKEAKTVPRKQPLPTTMGQSEANNLIKNPATIASAKLQAAAALMIKSPPQGKNLSGKVSALAGAIRLPSKARRVVKVVKMHQPMTEQSDERLPSVDSVPQNGAKFNPYGNQMIEQVTLPQQWQQQLPLAIHDEKQRTKRPSTPEATRKHCLDCGNMKDYIFGLQREVKRLQDLANEFNLQIIMAGGTPQEEELQMPGQPSKQVQALSKKGEQSATSTGVSFKKICPECPTTHKRQQAKLQRQVQEAAATATTSAPSNGQQAPGHLPSQSLLFPQRNNLIEGASNPMDSPNSKHLLSANSLHNGFTNVAISDKQGSGGVRICQLKDMRRQAFVQEQFDFVGKLTSQQQAIKLPGSNAAELVNFNSATSASATSGANIILPARGSTPNRLGSSNLAFRKKKASSVIQQLPPLASSAAGLMPKQQQPVNFQPQPLHTITKEDSEEAYQINQP